MADFWDDDNDEQQEIESIKKNPFQKAKVYDTSESEDEDRRRVKTPKEKLEDQIKKLFLEIKDNVNDRVMTDLSSNYDDLIKIFEKVKSLFDSIPKKYLKSLYLIETLINNFTKEDRDQLTQSHFKSFNALKKKFTKDYPSFESQLTEFKESKPEEEVEEEEEEDKMSELSDLSENEDKVSVDEDVELAADNTDDPAIRRLKWVKKVEPTKEKEKDKEKGDEKEQERDRERKEREKEKQRRREMEEARMQNITDKDIEKEINEISKQRGNIQSKATEYVSRLEILLESVSNKILHIKLLNVFVSVTFETSPGHFSMLSSDTWKRLVKSIRKMKEIFESEYAGNSKDEEIENVRLLLRSTFVTFTEKLDYELHKSLQYTDRESSAYVTHILNEIELISLCLELQEFYRGENDLVALAKLDLIVLLHLYYKNDIIIKKLAAKFKESSLNSNFGAKLDNPQALVNVLSTNIFQHSDEKSKIKASLAVIYFLSLHNEYLKAKNLFRKSNIYQIINVLKDDNIKLFYNRAVTQLGLAAFRSGKYLEAQQYLTPLCQNGTNKLKLHLAQSYSEEKEKSLFYDKEEKKRTIPFIMTINIDEVECVFYVSCIVNDLPSLIIHRTGRNSTYQTTFLKKVIDNYEKQIFNGPAETNKEMALCAASHLLKGDWKQCLTQLYEIKTLNMKDYQNNKESLYRQVKETALRAFLLFYLKEYQNHRLEHLSKRFELDVVTVKKIINQMIMNDEIEGKWDNDVFQLYRNPYTNPAINNLQENIKTITQLNLKLMNIAN